MNEYDRLDRQIQRSTKAAIFLVRFMVRLLRVIFPWVNEHHGAAIGKDIAYGVLESIQYPELRSGLKIINFDNMLKKGYDYHFEKIISSACYDRLRELAMEEMYKVPVGGDRYNWLENIVDGKLPYGYVIR